MNTTPHILLIGIDPLLLDFSLPEFAAMPGLTAEKIEAGTKAALDELNALGYVAEKCWVDLGATASGTVIDRLRRKSMMSLSSVPASGWRRAISCCLKSW